MSKWKNKKPSLLNYFKGGLVWYITISLCCAGKLKEFKCYFLSYLHLNGAYLLEYLLNFESSLSYDNPYQNCY